jgi:hypothetical protein
MGITHRRFSEGLSIELANPDLHSKKPAPTRLRCRAWSEAARLSNVHSYAKAMLDRKGIPVTKAGLSQRRKNWL